jgi:hypothetical protein
MRPRGRYGRTRTRAAVLGGLVVGIIASAALVWGSTSAAFYGRSSNNADSWAAGTVALSDDDGGTTPTTGTAMFSVAGIQPGDTGQQCITVTYGGTVAAAVKLYQTGASGSLGATLNITVEQGTGGSYSSCTGFITGSTIYTGTLGGLSTTYAGGVGTWAATNGATKTYRTTWSVQDDNAGAGQTAQTTFTWEAQNT